METKVLVAYASKYGATAEIAERIGQALREADLAADVRQVDQVGDLTRYRAVVLGSAVYIGQWRKEAVRFLEANVQTLAEKPVWLFSSGPTGDGDAVELVEGWRFPSKLQPLADRIKPRDTVVFHGAIDPKKLNFLLRWMLRNVKSASGDYRQWDAITAWATGIAAAVKVES